MTKKIYYEKRGRRYVPVSEYDSDLHYSFGAGSHLVTVLPGVKSERHNIDPALAPMIAAGRVAEEAIVSAMHQVLEARPSRTPLTAQQQRAWQSMKRALGEDQFYIQYASLRDAVDEGLKVMQKEAQELMTHPAVRDAYEQFLMVCKLTKEKQNGH